MKKNSLFLLITCFLITTLSAQTIQWGEEIGRRSGASGIYNIVGSIGEQTLAEHYFEAGTINGIKTGKDKYSLVLFDKKNNLLKSEELHFKVEKKSLNYRSSEMLNGRLYAICDFSNKKLKKKFLFAIELDTKTLKPLGPPKKIAETFIGKTKLTWGFGFKFNTPEGEFIKTVSNNSSYMAVLSFVTAEEDKPYTYDLAVYNESMELVWDKRIAKDDTKGNFFLGSMVLDDLGNTYHLITEGSPDEEGASQSIRAYRYKGNESENYDLEIVKGQINIDTRLTIGNNNDVIYTSLFGIFNNNGKVKSIEIEGLKYLIIDGLTSEVKHEKEVMFDPNTQEEIREVKMNRGSYNPFTRFTLSDIWIGKNDEIFVLGEQLLTSTPGATTGYYSNTTYYHYQDIFIWKITPEKGVAWVNKINKNQTIMQWFPSMGGAYYYFIDDANRLRGFGGSYFSSLDENGIHILYTEKGGEKEDYKGRFDPAWTYATIDMEGEVKIRLLTQNLPKKASLIPASSRKLSPDNIILLANQRKKYQIGSLSFE